MDKKILGVPIIWQRSKWLNFFIFSSITSSLFALGYNNSNVSCLLALYQNLVLPFLAVNLLLASSSPSTRIKYSCILGGLMGMIGATSHLTFLAFGFYFLGGRETILGANNNLVPTITSETILMEITLYVTSWIILVGISAISGLIGGALIRTQANADINSDQ